MLPIRPPVTILWILSEWRCEQDSADRLRLFHGDILIAEHAVRSNDLVQTYADLWRAAIADIAQPVRVKLEPKSDRLRRALGSSFGVS